MQAACSVGALGHAPARASSVAAAAGCARPCRAHRPPPRGGRASGRRRRRPTRPPSRSCSDGTCTPGRPPPLRATRAPARRCAAHRAARAQAPTPRSRRRAPAWGAGGRAACA
eukprot:6229288-Prymnesium_polylepis.2